MMVTENIPYQTPRHSSSTPSVPGLTLQGHFQSNPFGHTIRTLKSYQGASMKSSHQRSELNLENAITSGIRANGRAIFDLRISGVDIFDLLKLLEGGAMDGNRQSFLEVRKCVFLAEKLRNQVRRQGF